MRVFFHSEDLLQTVVRYGASERVTFVYNAMDVTQRIVCVRLRQLILVEDCSSFIYLPNCEIDNIQSRFRSAAGRTDTRIHRE